MLELKNVSKTFPGVKALDNVSIKFKKGEIHALLGENGAGKSTLIKIISGLYKPDKDSEIFFNNEAYKINNTRSAIEKGIVTFYQDLQLIPQVSVAENIMLDKLPIKGKTGILDWKEMNRVAKKYLDLIELKVEPSKTINRLNVAQRQLVKIAKALASNIKVLLLDEPTASLAEDEAQYLFKIMYKLKKNGILIIFVSHILEEVLQVATKISILRDGKCVVTDDIKNLDRKKIVKYMIGREEDKNPYGDFIINKSKKVLEVKHLTREKKAYNINFTLYEGEILGFYGLVGAGRTELARILIGHDKYDSGEIIINGKKARIRSVYDALSKYSLGYVTEVRRKDGLILTDNIKTNITITIWDRIANGFGLVSSKKERDITWKQIKDLDIKTIGFNQKVGNLSGGNQQKVNIAKWLAAEVDVLIIDEPTVGIDVGAKEYFARLIWSLAKRKKSIILISSDMPEIIKLANRILVFSRNRIVGEVDNSSKNYKETSAKIGDYISEFKVTSA
jgi:ribose transport system ATP-binding protein